MDQSQLNPDQQQQLFETLKEHGLLSDNVGQSPDDNSSYTSNTPLNMGTLQSLIKHSTNPSAVPMQEGDKIHPMDAIQQITQKMGGAQPVQAPNQSFLSPVHIQEPGHGLGSFISKLITGHPIMYDVGNPVMGTSQAPDTSNLPASMAPKAIGTDANGNPVYDYSAVQKLQGQEGAMATALAKGAASNPQYGLHELLQMGYTPTDALKRLGGDPNGMVSQKELNLAETHTKNTVFASMVDIKKQMVDVMRDKLHAMYEGPGAAQKVMSEALQRTANIGRFYDQYKVLEDNNFQATKQTRNLLTFEGVRIIAGSNGVVSDDAFNRMAGETAQTKIADWQTWLKNDATPAQFQSFANQLKDIVDLETQTNASIFAQGQQLGAKVIKDKVSNFKPNFAVPGAPAPTVSLNPNGSITLPPTLFTPDVVSYAAKYRISPAKALQIKLQRTGQ